MQTLIKLFILIYFSLIVTSTCVSRAAESKKETVKTNSPYAENVHMYICTQALNLLKDQFPEYNFTQFDQRIGDLTDYGTRPWQTGKITTGAYREDKEDVVFDIRGPFGWYVSNSHFWNADDRSDGDNTLTHLDGIGNYPNAFTKFRRYLDGDWHSWSNGYGPREFINYLHISGYLFRYSYFSRGLINFYRTRKIWLEDFFDLLGRQYIVREEVTADDLLYNSIIWEVLGRQAHLLQDLSVPAHVHNDVHVRGLDGGDCYHNFIDDGAYLNYSWITARDAGGFINPYDDPDDPLRYLFYTSSQLADHFPSGPDCLEIPQQHTGNNFLPGGTNPMIENYYQQLGTPPVNIPDPDTEAAYCLNHAIRATAGLFYWFGIETGIFPPLPEMIPEITGFTNTSPDHRLYRGETMTINCLTTGNARDFKFDMFVCDTSRECFYPVPGLILRQSGNSLSISNVNFRNNWTCLKYDSVCFNTDPGNLSEPPLHFTLRVTASNQYGHSTGFYSLGNLMWIFPNEFIRPNPPPVSGCPLLLVNDGLKFIYENDLLHRSEFPGNQNKIIEDKYVLRTAPATFPDDSTIMLAVKETSVDINYFDQFRLLAADHPEGTELAVTESNDPVIYYPKYLILPSHAELSGKDITKMLNYGIQYPKYITGNGDDVITAGFNGKLSTSGQDSVALILNPGAGPHKPVIPVVKDFAGTIDIQDIHGNTEISDISFAKRIFNSQVTIPVFADKGFNSMDIRWKDDFNISYLAYTGIYYSGFSTQELELVEAEDITSGNILNLLKEKDDMLVQTDSSDQIILRFKDRSAPVRTGYKRSYIFITEGRYQKSVAFNPENKGSVINQTGNEKEHEVIKYFISNYPNPFNPVTFINYGLEIKSNVSLKVYNILGNEVAVVVNGIQNAGEHRVEFDGSRLASGIYFYTLKAGNFVKTRKMLLLK